MKSGDKVKLEPTKIGNLMVDAVISRETTFASEVSEYPVETGFVVSDHVTRQPVKLSMEVIFTPTPVTYLDSKDINKINTTTAELIEIYKNGEPITVETSDMIYENMVLTNAPIRRTIEDGICLRLQLDFQQVTIVTEKMADQTSEEAEGKSGDSEVEGGTAAQEDIGLTVKEDYNNGFDMDNTEVDKSVGGDYSTEAAAVCEATATALAIALVARW